MMASSGSGGLVAAALSSTAQVRAMWIDPLATSTAFDETLRDRLREENAQRREGAGSAVGDGDEEDEDEDEDDDEFGQIPDNSEEDEDDDEECRTVFRKKALPLPRANAYDRRGLDWTWE